MSTQLTTKNYAAELNVRRLIVLAIVVVTIVFVLGVVSSRGVAFVLSAIGHGLQSAAHRLDSSLNSPAAYHSGAALEAYESGDDPDLFSPVERSQLEGS